MKNNSLMGKIKYKLRRTTGYNVKNKPKEKSFYRKQFRNLILCMLIVLIILIIKQFDTKPTEEAINVIKTTLDYDISFKEDSEKVVNYVKGFLEKSEELAPVFNDQESNEENIKENNQEILEEGFISPVSGEIYQSFGEEKKSNNITVFHKGIKIKTMESVVKSIGKGTVIEISNNRLLGNKIIIDYGEIQAVYGNLDEISVDKGAVVDKGQKIGKLKNPSKGESILYLEIREKNQPVNPKEKININSKNLVSR